MTDKEFYHSLSAYNQIKDGFRDVVPSAHYYSMNLWLTFFSTVADKEHGMPEEYRSKLEEKRVGRFILEDLTNLRKEMRDDWRYKMGEEILSETLRERGKEYNFEEFVEGYRKADGLARKVLSDIEVFKEKASEMDLSSTVEELEAMEYVLGEIKEGWITPPAPMDKYIEIVKKKKEKKNE